MTKIEYKKFYGQCIRAKQRGIEFNLTFEEWWNIWQTSGKWDQRGCHKGQYVMSRYNDTGAYEVGNVFIQTTEENLSETKGVSRPKPEGFGLKISAIVKGRPSAMKGRQLGYKRKSSPRGSYEPVTCPHCNKSGGPGPMKQWHFDNCKEKELA